VIDCKSGSVNIVMYENCRKWVRAKKKFTRLQLLSVIVGNKIKSWAWVHSVDTEHSSR